MDNAAKALYIAGSLLIALLVISLMVYTFNNLGGVQKQKDEIEYEESVSDFNKEYEAFNKKIMYGVDVISCINKAVSNNEKYVKGGNWAISGASDVEAIIQVEVLLKSELKESFQIYYANEKGKESKLYNITPSDVVAQFSGTIKDFFKIKSNNILSSYDIDEDNIVDIFKKVGNTDTFHEEILNMEKANDKNVVSEIFNSSEGTYYVMHLLVNDGKKTKYKFEKGNKSLSELVSYATNSEIVRANDTTDNKIWSSVRWTTVLADFKKRRFTCSDINYNDDTGRIESITFKEK